MNSGGERSPDVDRVDAALAAARAVLAAATLGAILLSPWRDRAWARLAVALIVAQFFVAASLLAGTWWLQWQPSGRLRAAGHGLDIAWAAAAAALAPGVVGLSSVFFAIVSAGHQWGIPHAMGTAAVGLAVGGVTTPAETSFVGLATGSVALLGTAGVVGWLSAEHRRTLEREAQYFLVFRRTQARLGFESTLGAALAETRDLFQAREVLLATRDVDTGRDVFWSLRRGDVPGRAQALDLEPGLRADCFFETRADAWDAVRRRGGGFSTIALEADGRPLRERNIIPSAALERLCKQRPAARFTALSFRPTDTDEARVLLVDAELGWPRRAGLRFAQRLVRELGGIVHGRFLLGRLRRRVGGLERARIARELHDGTIQTLVSLEMQAEVLRRQSEPLSAPLAAELARIKGLLHGEVLRLRETMERLRPVEIEPAQLVGFLDETIARFDRETGIHALFDCDLEEVSLPASVCQELGRIVQEGLQNVRKHSGARNVLVRLGRATAGLQLVIDDDGRGFPFSGELSHAQLDEGRKGPYVIRERVKALGGRMSIRTAPGRGARLEILLPPPGTP